MLECWNIGVKAEVKYYNFKQLPQTHYHLYTRRFSPPHLTPETYMSPDI